jgi:peptidoglycan/xylan/chitin deacetylase (PgdA/CDA1 family)
MKSKYIFITLLLALLVYTVYQMMKFETQIREERKIKFYVEDESKPLLTKLPDEDLREIALNSDYYFTAGTDFFKSLKIQYEEGVPVMTWEKIFLKGVNLGVAIPGKFPAEFALTFDEYLNWMMKIGEMNANVVRVYTILPPEFYEALAFYNLHHFDRPLYIMHGVWTEVPASENYFEPVYTREFEKEIIDALDVIHGRAVLPERPGKASGIYSTDVSKYVISILLGREWEPGSVFKTNQVNAIRQYRGDFVCMNDGNPMEAWLAKMMDFTVLYETQHYRYQHPVSFVNWLPLDPMFHNTEIIENKKVREYDNDLESIDFSRFQATDIFYPGIYAAYHAYPYYPDFVSLQDSYQDPTGKEGDHSSYFYYLQDLKLHTPGLPLVIAEYGLPSSRGNSHYSPSGFHQGGHSEAEQARLSLELTKDIVTTGCAGAIYFEWIDEWFKHNWLVMDFEQPADDRKLWHNMENPEQNFGILALENKIKIIDGKLTDWDAEELESDDIKLLCDADATYFYIASRLNGFDFTKNNLYIAIDTYSEEKGDHMLPFTGERFQNGFEFLLEFRSEDSALILVDEPYSVYTDIYNDLIPVYASQENSNGKFIHQLMMTNRSRVSLTGERTDSVIFDRSPLVFGKSSDPKYSNADWYFDESDNVLEIRLDWHLLNVCDPAKRFVLDDQPGTSDIEYAATDAFKIYAFITSKADVVNAKIPKDEPWSFTWQEWDTPVFTERLKPVYSTLKDYFKDLAVADEEEQMELMPDESFSIAGFSGNKTGAVSISFDNASYSQYLYALPVLIKYDLSATFGIIPELLSDSPRLTELEGDAVLKRLSVKEVREMDVYHDIAYQAVSPAAVTNDEIQALSGRTEATIRSLHRMSEQGGAKLPGSLLFARGSSGKGPVNASSDGVRYSVIPFDYTQIGLDSVLAARKDQWTIIRYCHLYESRQEIPHQAGTETTNKLFLHRSDFEQQVRLMRNRNLWIASETEVFKYLKEKAVSTIRTEKYKNMIFLRIINPLDNEIYDQPLTIEFRSDAQIIRVEGSEADGVYSRKTGSFYFNALPGKEITIEIIE